jgi:hypothetical protein
VAANAFAPKTRPNERKPPRDKHRPGRSNSGGKTSGSQPSSSSTAKKQSSLAAQIKAAEDYDPSASSSGRFVIREDYLSSSSSPDVGRKGKGKEKQESSSHQLQRQHPDARTRPTAKAKARATKDGEPVRTRRKRRGSDDSGDSSSDIDVDWSSSSTIVDSWDDVVEGEEATQHKAEPKAADPWEQTFADEEEDYDDEEEEGDEEENDDNEEEGGDVVDGEKIGLERGRKYKLVVEKFPTADAPRQPAETVPAPIMPSNVPPRGTPPTPPAQLSRLSPPLLGLINASCPQNPKRAGSRVTRPSSTGC